MNINQHGGSFESDRDRRRISSSISETDFKTLSEFSSIPARRSIQSDCYSYKDGVAACLIEMSRTSSLANIKCPPPPVPPPSAAVQVQRAFKSFSNGDPVLNNFNMSVPQGTIYSLLGSSGCGKTTILSCIVGIRKLDSGSITVFGQTPGSDGSEIPGRAVGYMPQDIALYLQLTIKELLQYYGRLYNMNNSQISKRIQFLTNFLDLPKSSRVIQNLSGGQQRRVSLSACLLHEPPLLILDEPTVGVDPLLRENIWAHLCKLVSEKKTTVIITTHYIEEARQSHTIGLIRNGRLLAENHPESLLKEHNSLLLEEVVLKLCRYDAIENKETLTPKVVNDSSSDDINSTSCKQFNSTAAKKLFPCVNQTGITGLKYTETVVDLNENQTTVRQNDHSLPTYKSQRFISVKLRRILAVVLRNFLILLRSPVFMIGICLLPAYQSILTGLVLGPEPKNLNFGIINPEIGLNISICDEERLEKQGKCDIERLSCSYLNTLPSDLIVPVVKASIEDALEDIQRGKLVGYMSFPTNYSGHSVNRAVLSKIFSTNEIIDGSTVSFRLDMSQYLTGAILIKNFLQSYQTFAQTMFSNCGEDPRYAQPPINFKEPIYGTYDSKFEDYISPAALIMVLFFLPYGSCVISHIRDRREGTLERSMVTGLTMTDLLTGFVITDGFIVVVQAVLSVFFITFVSGMEIKGSVIAFIFLGSLTGVAGLSFGFLTAQVVNSEKAAIMAGMAWYIPNLIISGVLWPLEAVHPIFRFFCYCLPCTWAISGARSIIGRGWPIYHPYVWPGYVVLFIWTVVTWILAIALARRRSNH